MGITSIIMVYFMILLVVGLTYQKDNKMEEKTGYDWCEDAKLRVIDISNWDTDWANFNDSYYKEKLCTRVL
jgi:hypothetical protein